MNGGGGWKLSQGIVRERESERLWSPTWREIRELREGNEGEHNEGIKIKREGEEG